MIPMNPDALNFIYNFNSNNTIISSMGGFHFILFCEQNMIFHYCTFPVFYLIVQNNFVIINFKIFYKNILESNYNIFNIFTNHNI